jgi:hypothetical protein
MVRDIRRETRRFASPGCLDPFQFFGVQAPQQFSLCNHTPPRLISVDLGERTE